MSSTIESSPTSTANEANSLEFFIQQFVNKMWTSTIVVVKSVSNAGNLSPVGSVSIQPLVGQINNAGKVYAHADIYDAPYFRLQGGSDAIIIDPKVGDIGVALFASRDVSAAKSSKKLSPPGSARKFDIADAFYFGGFLNGVPSQYLRFIESGIEIVSPTKVTITAPTVEVNSPNIVLNGPINQGAGSNAGNATFGGTITAIGEVTGNGIKLSTHKHGGVQTGSGSTGVMPIV